MNDFLPDVIIRRLPSYYRQLQRLEAANIEQISSSQLGEQMHQTASQIRRDLNCIGAGGRQGYGYRVSELKRHIGKMLGMDREHVMVVISSKGIGQAVLEDVAMMGGPFRLLAIFTDASLQTGGETPEVPVLPAAQLEAFLAAHDVEIAVIAVPSAEAPAVYDRVTACGIRAVWNFAPVDLDHDNRRATVVNVHLMDSLQVLSCKITQR